MTNRMERSRIESWIWVIAFVLSSLRATIFWNLFLDAFHMKALPWIEIGLWMVLAVLAFRSLQAENLFNEFMFSLKRNLFLVAFIVVVLASISWSVAPGITAYRSLTVLFSSLLGAYIGFRCSNRKLMDILYKFGAMLLVLCFAFAVFLPVAGAMTWVPYNGAWRGVFWHKNHLGSIAALINLVYLLSALDRIGFRKWSLLALDVILYLFSLGIVFFSRSAAGLVVVLALNFSAVLAFVWIKMRSSLKPVHYYLVLGLGAIAIIILLLNLNFVFALFNRSPTLTGRVPVWNYLVRVVIRRSPWLGYGFGAVWSIASFREGLQHRFDWGYPLVIADNGFLDILLHVGFLGFIPFLGVLILALVRSFKLAIRSRTLPDFFPLLLVVFAVFANLSFSLFLETETFVWLIIIAASFATSRQLHQQKSQSVTS